MKSYAKIAKRHHDDKEKWWWETKMGDGDALSKVTLLKSSSYPVFKLNLTEYVFRLLTWTLNISLVYLF